MKHDVPAVAINQLPSTPQLETPRKGSQRNSYRKWKSFETLLEAATAEKSEDSTRTPVPDPLAPNLATTMTGFAIHVANEISSDTGRALRERYELFDETLHPVDTLSPPESVDPMCVIRYLDKIQSICSVDAVAFVIALSFLKRLRKKCPLLPFNWRTWKRILTTCIVIGSKMHEDLSVFLEDFSNEDYFPYLSVSVLGKTESLLLRLLDFEISWTLRDYTSTILTLDLSSSSIEE